MRVLISLAVIFFLFSPVGASAKEDVLLKDFPLNPKKLIYLNCSGKAREKHGTNEKISGIDWIGTAVIGDGRIGLNKFSVGFMPLPCEELAAYGRFGCKIQSQKHGHLTAKDTFIDKEDIRNERGKKYSIFEYQAVVINRYSGAIDIFGSRKNGRYWAGDGTCTIGKRLF